MAEDQDAGEKTEPATARKRQEAREQGTVARSQDLVTAMMLLAAFLVVYFTSDLMLDQFSTLSLRSYEALGSERLDFEQVVSMGVTCLWFIVIFIMPLAAVVLVMGIVVNIAQVGFLISLKPLAPDAGRVNPWKGLTRIASRRGLMRFLLGLLKLTVVGVVLGSGYMSLVNGQDSVSLFAIIHTDLRGAIALFMATVFSLGSKAAAALLVLALIDFAYQRWQHSNDLMMTKQQVQEELRRMEGDPKLKFRRRRLQQKLALQRMMQDVPKADVVITNPTHVACAIRYLEREMSAPRLLAKGQDHLALRIRELAVAHGVPVVEQAPLARLIYQSTEVGDEVSPDLYQPIAEVLAYVFQLRRRGNGVGGRRTP
ncbi:MAG: flagellar biosynthesis protein FlhB [Planctomycetota bacterium]